MTYCTLYHKYSCISFWSCIIIRKKWIQNFYTIFQHIIITVIHFNKYSFPYNPYEITFIFISFNIHFTFRYKPVFFIDDDPKLLNKLIDGIRVYSSDEKKLKKLIENYQISNVIFSTNKISQTRKKIYLKWILLYR